MLDFIDLSPIGEVELQGERVDFLTCELDIESGNSLISFSEPLLDSPLVDLIRLYVLITQFHC
jgi:hypothetical protein